MPVNAAIYNRFAQSPTGSSLATLGEILAAKSHNRQAEQQNAILLQKQQREQEAEQAEQEKAAAITSIFERHVTDAGELDDPQAVVAEVSRIDPDRALKFQSLFDQHAQNQTAKVTAEDTQRAKVQTRNVNMLRRVLAAPASSQWALYKPALNLIAQSDPNAAEWLGVAPDPNKMQALIDQWSEPEKPATEPAGFTLGAGQTRFSPTGEPIAAVPAREASESAGSDYGRFEADYIAAEAAKAGKTPDKLTPPERVKFKIAARKAFGQADDAAFRGWAPVVIQTADGPQLLNRGQGTTAPITSASGDPIKPAPTAEMRNRSAVRDTTVKSIQAIEDLSKKVITKRGVAQRATAAGRSVESALGNDPEYRVYQDARMGLAGNLAVLQQGSRPSDADIKAIWLPLVPDAFRDTDQSAAMKWELIYKMSGFTPGATNQGGGAVAPTGRFNPATGRVEPVQ